MQNFIREHIKGVVVLILVISLAFWEYSEYKRYKNQAKMPLTVVSAVQAAEPASRDIIVTRSYIGRVEAINDVNIVPYISGYVESINASGGQKVQKDDVLMMIRQDEYKSALMSAYANILAAKADFANAKSQYERMKKAGARAVSQTELDNAQASYLTTQASLKQAEAAFYSAQINFGYTYLRAPFNGVLGNISASVGDFVSPNATGIMRLVQYDPIRVVFSITDKEYLTAAGKINDFAGEEVRLLLANGDIFDGSGAVKYTSNQIDEATNSLAVYAEFSNEKQKLMPNAYVKVLLDHPYKDVVLLDKNLLQMKTDGNYVYTVENGILNLNKVILLADYQNQYVLANTFSKGTMLVTEEVDGRLLGQKVDVKTLTAEK